MLIKSAKDTRSAADRVKAHTGEEKVRRRRRVLVVFMSAAQSREWQGTDAPARPAGVPSRV